MERILLIEDDVTLQIKLKTTLEKWHLDVVTDVDFSDCLIAVKDTDPKLIIMDVGLPVYDGFYWCNKIRQISNVPILFLSSHDSDRDMVMAMNMGGDDFMTKPFSMDVLIAKINAMLRRTYDYKNVEVNKMSFMDLVLDISRSELTFNGNHCSLTRNETRILMLLIEHKNRIVSRSQIMQALWDDDQFVNENTLTVNLNRLRKKLQEFTHTDYIETKKGQGYILNEIIS